jgi:3-methylfumaryl-CoA hydratase
MMATLDADLLDAPSHDWLGRSEVRSDFVTSTPLAALAATLDRDDPEPLPGSEVPPLAHWLFFLPLTRQSGIGADGEPRSDGFLPPVKLPRRLWAGGRMRFHEITRESRIIAIEGESGSNGRRVFVRVRHTISNARGVAITEEQDVVYRDSAAPGAPEPPPLPAPSNESWSRAVAADPILLFRYSALTFNGHRIHYDRGYATDVEGHAGLVVQVPLVATLLVDLFRRKRPQARLTHFSFAAVHPLVDIHPVTLCGQEDGSSTVRLWARNHERDLAMHAEARIEHG